MLQELFDYVGFDEQEARVLQRIGPHLAPFLPEVVDAFYEAVERSPSARAVFVGGQAQIERQKTKLSAWMEELFSGLYDEAYFERRARIGRVHVLIGLDQRLILSAMNVIRRNLHRALRASTVPPADLDQGHDAIDRICDVDLAIVLETYRERDTEKERAQERLATIGQLAASIGHELRNPLAVIETSVHLLGRRLDDPQSARHLGRINQQVKLSGAIIEDLLALARDRPPEPSELDLGALLADAVAAVPRATEVELRTEIPADLGPVWADGSQLRQVLINLLLNAVQAIGKERMGVVTVRASRDEAGGLVLEMIDDGPGIQPDVLPHLFEPLVTSRPAGIGLGLALCERIVAKHGGTIVGGNEQGGGARFEIRLPGRDG